MLLALLLLWWEQNGHHFADDIFLKEHACSLIQIPWECVLKDPTDNMSWSVQVMAWLLKGNKPFYQSMLTKCYYAQMGSLGHNELTSNTVWLYLSDKRTNTQWETMLTHCGLVTPYGDTGLGQHRSWSTLAQEMACCLTAPSHYLNKCWLFLHARPWIPGDEIAIFTVVIH